MRVAMYYRNGDVRMEEMPVPRIGPGEVLVKIMASGICGSDVLEWYRRKKAPLVLGHEVAGEVIEAGEGAYRCREGERVVAAHHVPCFTCHLCMKGHHTMCETLRGTSFDPGGFAEYVRLPAINVDRGLFLLPGEVSFEEGTFTEPLACVLRGQRVADVRPGDSILVIGSGISGILHIDYARASGAGRIMASDIVPYRLEAARRFGAEVAIEAGGDLPERVREVNDGRFADKVIVCTGNEGANEQALRCVEKGGTVLFFALTDPGVSIPVPMNELFFGRGVKLTTSYAGSPADYADALELIRAGRVRVREMITQRLALEETQIGFEIVARARDSIKVIIEPQR